MGIGSEQSLIMARRLKQLREEKGLSHEKLSRALLDQYGVKISPDSLINYEVADEHHSKAYKNQGMRVEYLRCLSDFYGVSADYILGQISDPCRFPSAIDELGLSPKAVEHLYECQKLPFGSRYIPGLNLLLESTGFLSTLREVADLAEFIKETKDSNGYSFLSEDKKSAFNITDLANLSSALVGRQLTDELAAVTLANRITSVYPELQGQLTVLCGIDNIEYLINKIARDFHQVVETAVHYDEFKFGLIMKKSQRDND